jgi:hypothetical protein
MELHKWGLRLGKLCITWYDKWNHKWCLEILWSWDDV